MFLLLFIFRRRRYIQLIEIKNCNIDHENILILGTKFNKIKKCLTVVVVVVVPNQFVLTLIQSKFNNHCFSIIKVLQNVLAK